MIMDNPRLSIKDVTQPSSRYFFSLWGNYQGYIDSLYTQEDMVWKLAKNGYVPMNEMQVFKTFFRYEINDMDFFYHTVFFRIYFILVDNYKIKKTPHIFIFRISKFTGLMFKQKWYNVTLHCNIHHCM